MPTTDASMERPRAGLRGESESIPLEGVSVEADLNEFSARVVITQRYRNAEDRPIEAVYTFPIDELAAVCGFEAVVGGVHYVAEVKPREAAFRAYDDALQEGHGAFLLDEERPDIFAVSVGNIPPGGEVLLKLTYVTELVLDGQALRFTLPTTVAPRYAPASDRRGIGRSDADALNPPVRWTVPYGLDFTVRIAMPGPITAIQAPSHPMAIEMHGAQATVRLAQTDVALDRDVVLLVEAGGVHTPHVRVEKDEAGQLTAALVVRPEFDAAYAPSEVIFIVDRSGSMGGSSIAQVRNALQLCLRSLTPACRFNIIGFGSTCASLFDASQPYTEQTLAAASAHVQALEADLGGTEILGALKFAFLQPPIAGLPRQLVILTDGEVTNTDEVMAAIAAHAAETRVFTFGIGRGASAYLVRGMARAGRGVAEFIHPGERVEARVLRQFGRLLSPALAEVSVTWGDLAATPALSSEPPVFSGERLVAYAFLADAHRASVAVSARGPRGDVSWSASMPDDVLAGRTLATLAARRRIRELEEQPEPLARFGSRQAGRVADRAEQEIVRLATTYGLASRLTSFVAIEHRQGATPADLQLRRIPVALTSGWGGLAGSTRDLTIATFPGGARLSAPAPGAVMDQLDSSLAASVTKAARRIATGVGFGRPKPVKSPAAAPPISRRPLDALVALQHANGSWDLTADLARVVGLALDVLDAKRPAALTREAWATLVALAWLDAKAADQREEWQALARKADAWLQLVVPAAALGPARAMAREIIRA